LPKIYLVLVKEN